MLHKNYDPRNAYPVPAKPRKRTAGSRAFWLVVVVGCATLFVARTGVSTADTVTAPGRVKLSGMNARSVQETAELNGIDAGAAAGMAFIVNKEKSSYTSNASRNVPPNATKINLRGIRSSAPQVTKEKALADAITQAQGELAEALRSLDPPVRYTPNEETVKTEYLVPTRTIYLDISPEDKEALTQANLDPNRVWAKVDLDVSESQLRQLRGKDRLFGSAKWFGGAFAAMLIAYGFLRFDTYTRGHLTLPLILAAFGGILAIVVAITALG
jgi:hypothetical protein